MNIDRDIFPSTSTATPKVDRTLLAKVCIDQFEQSAESIASGLDDLMKGCGTWFSTIQGFDRKEFATDCMLVVTELAEAVEADRTGAQDDHCPEFEGRAAELADVLVRVFHMAAKYHLPIGDAFVAKMRYNFTRPIKHGKGY